MPQKLTSREAEVLQFVAIGKKDWEIGQILNIAPSTVRTHIKEIFRKLEAINRPQAVYVAMSSKCDPFHSIDLPKGVNHDTER